MKTDLTKEPNQYQCQYKVYKVIPSPINHSKLEGSSQEQNSKQVSLVTEKQQEEKEKDSQQKPKQKTLLSSANFPLYTDHAVYDL